MRFPQTTTRTKTLATRSARMQVYSCDFCEFIQSSLDQIDGDDQSIEVMDGAFEAKYLFHMRTVHGLEK